MSCFSNETEKLSSSVSNLIYKDICKWRLYFCFGLSLVQGYFTLPFIIMY